MRLPNEIELIICNYAAQMVLAERNKIWKNVHAEFGVELLRHAEPYMVLNPELFGWGLCLRHGPYKNWLICSGFITEEQYPLDL